MPRRLRTLTGCLVCRRRHVKCGEEKPTCCLCTKLKLSCVWPHDGANNGTRTLVTAMDSIPGLRTPVMRRYPALSSYQNGTMANGYVPFDDNITFTLIAQCPNLLCAVRGPVALPLLKDPTPIINLALREPIVRHSFAAFAAQMLAAQHSQLIPEALSLYNKAIASQRAYVQTPLCTTKAMSVLSMMLMMGCYEWLGRGIPHFAFAHFAALLLHAGSIIRGIKASENCSILSFCRFPIELALYVVSGLSMFSTNLDSLMKHLDWESINTCLRLAPGAHQEMKDSDYPILYNRRAEARTVLLRTIHLGRKTSLETPRAQEANTLLQQLDQVESRLSRQYGRSDADNDVKNFWLTRFEMASVLIRICLAKIANPSICSGSQHMQSMFNSATQLYDRVTSGSSVTVWPTPDATCGPQWDRCPVAFWHFFVLVCTAHDPKYLENAATILRGRTPMVHEEFYESLLATVQIISERKVRNQANCKASIGLPCHLKHDGLDLLFLPHGVLSWQRSSIHSACS